MLLSAPIHDPYYTLGGPLKRLPLRKAAVAFIAAVCLCLCGLLYLQLKQSRDHDLALAQVSSANLTRAMAQQAQDTFRAADLVVSSLVDWIQDEGYEAARNPRLQQTFVRRAQALEQLHGLFLVDREGRWVVSSFGDLTRPVTFDDRDYFTFHQRNASREVHIGPAIRSRQNGEWIIPLSRRINGPQGEFQGVLMAGIRMAYFDRFFKSFSIDDQALMFLALADGTLLARRPSDQQMIGKSLAQGPIFRTYLPQARSGSAMIRTPLDGNVRFYGYQQLQAYPLVVAAAIPEEVILRGWRANAVQSSVIVALVVLGISLFGWVFVLQVRNGERIEADLRAAQERLEVIATHDSLTGLGNRRLFQRVLETEFARSQRQQRRLSLILLDIDYFKPFNDNYGHLAGDQCLVQVARLVKSCCQRKTDLVVRYGGEEFAVLLADADIDAAYTLAEQIRERIRTAAIPHRAAPSGQLTVSLGCYAFVPTLEDRVELLIERADAALYQAKHLGRNRTQVMSEGGTLKDDAGVKVQG